MQMRYIAMVCADVMYIAIYYTQDSVKLCTQYIGLHYVQSIVGIVELYCMFVSIFIW